MAEEPKVFGQFPLNVDNSFAARVLEIKPSSIPGSGNGVFAKEFLAKGTPLGHYAGESINKAEMEKRYGDSVAPYGLTVTCYSTESCGKKPKSHANHTIYIDASDPSKSNWARFINDGPHSKIDANVIFCPRGQVVVSKNIPKGHELFVDYGEEYWQ